MSRSVEKAQKRPETQKRLGRVPEASTRGLEKARKSRDPEKAGKRSRSLEKTQKRPRGPEKAGKRFGSLEKAQKRPEGGGPEAGNVQAQKWLGRGPEI